MIHHNNNKYIDLILPNFNACNENVSKYFLLQFHSICDLLIIIIQINM